MFSDVEEKVENPIVFKEQLNGIEPTIAPISLKDYTVNDNDFLGEGYYGRVFGLSLKTEENFQTQWCIKIFMKSNPILIKMEFESQILLEKYKITNIKFGENNDNYQIKTKIYGKTLFDCFNNHYLSDANQYFFRKALINFLWILYHVPFTYIDFDTKNIMYDEINHRIEIIDILVVELKLTLEERFIKIGYMMNKFLGLIDINDNEERIFKLLEKAARVRENTEYTEKFDYNLLQKVLHPAQQSKEYPLMECNKQYKINRLGSEIVGEMCIDIVDSKELNIQEELLDIAETIQLRY